MIFQPKKIQIDLRINVRIYLWVNLPSYLHPLVIVLSEKSVPDGHTSMDSDSYRYRLMILYPLITCAIS